MVAEKEYVLIFPPALAKTWFCFGIDLLLVKFPLWQNDPDIDDFQTSYWATPGRPDSQMLDRVARK